MTGCSRRNQRLGTSLVAVAARQRITSRYALSQGTGRSTLTTVHEQRSAGVSNDALRLVSLEITGRCQLACAHCYAESGPQSGEGDMATTDWLNVIAQAARSGAARVQLIGGEPTLYRDLHVLVSRALSGGMEVEIFTNLVHVVPAMWALFERPGVRLATSYYSTDAAEHDAVTGRRSHDRTLANIREAMLRSIPLRVSVIQMHDQGVTDAALAELRALGVRSVGADRLREIGRGLRAGRTGPAELCGRCADGKLAVLPSGDAVPCLLSRWVLLGNVRTGCISDIYARSLPTRTALVAATVATRHEGTCGPDDKCGPDEDGGVCQQPTCLPHYIGP
jgi:hypothetical protein